MARSDGSVSWISWPAMLICTGVVALLVWLALPGLPGAVDFIGTTLRGATSAPAAGSEADAASTEPAADCRGLYPDRLWAELTWSPDNRLSPDTAAPATATTLTAVLRPQVRFTCTWRVEGSPQSIQTSVSSVSDDAGPLAQAGLSSDGFSCSGVGERVHCERDADGLTEIHDIGGGTWLSSILTGWAPEGYGELTAERVFAG